MASILRSVLFLTFLVSLSLIFVAQGDQIRGEIVEPGSDQGGRGGSQNGPEPVTRETIYFLTTPDDDNDENFEVTGPHKPFQRRTTESQFGPTEEPAFGGRGRETTENPDNTDRFRPGPGSRTTIDSIRPGRYTTEKRRPFGEVTDDPYERYTTERSSFGGRYTTGRTFGGFTDDPFDRYTTERYRPGSGFGGDRERGSVSGTDGINAKCQASPTVRNAARDRLNVCEQFIRCCSQECRAKGLEPKGNCKHDTIEGFDRSTSCPCKPPRVK